MDERKCYFPRKGVDDKVAELLSSLGYNKYLVASLRGLYDEYYKDDSEKLQHMESLIQGSLNGNPTDTIKLKELLLDFKAILSKKSIQAINGTKKSLPTAFMTLKRKYNAETYNNRLNMLSTLFSTMVTHIQNSYMKEQGVSLSREDICKGKKTSAGNKYGEGYIFEKMFDFLAARYSQLVEAGNAREALEIKKVLDSWPELITLTRVRIRNTEGIKLSQKISYAKNTDESSFGPNDMSLLFNAEEAGRESWQETNDMRSSFGSIGQEVRRVLSQIKTGKIDDLGFPMYYSPVTSHRMLLEAMKGITSEKEMMDVLESDSLPFGKDLAYILRTNSSLRTTFFNDINKNFQWYSTMKVTVENGVFKFTTSIINKVKNVFGEKYTAEIIQNNFTSPSSFVGASGNIEYKSLYSSVSKINQLTDSKDADVLGVKNRLPYFKNIKKADRARIIMPILNSLNIDISVQTLEKICKDARTYNRFMLTLEDVAYGIQNALSAKTRTKFEESLKAGVQELSTVDVADKNIFPDVSVKDYYFNAAEGLVKEKLDKLNTIISANLDDVSYESQVSYKNDKGDNVTFFSNVNPCFMGDRLKKLYSFYQNDNPQGLRDYLIQQYGNCPIFYSKVLEEERNKDSKKTKEGGFTNPWLDELYNSVEVKNGTLIFKEDSFVENFSNFSRFLGMNQGTVTFENFTDKQDLLAVFSMYFSDKQISAKRNYAHYPIFTMADSEVAKYIVAKRYSIDECKDMMYELFLSERERMALVKASNELVGGIENFKQTENSYTIFSFLNDTEEYPLKDYTKESFIEALDKYMKKEIEKFTKEIDSLGLLENKGQTYFSQELGQSKSLNSILQDFYWNQKLNMIAQLQLFTVDTAFYGKDITKKGNNEEVHTIINRTKDLQKRYKEIHAPGISINPEAVFNGSRISDGIERCIYFKDLDINAEISNPEFMESLLYTYSINKTNEQIKEAIDNGILIPKENKSEESNRIKQLKEFLGDNYNIYKKYQKNTLTDGQGYRSLDSYRKVMIMAGKWKENGPEEKVYQKIKDAANTYTKQGKNIPSTLLRELEESAVIFQPIKPYLYTFENVPVDNNQVLKVPVQHKYAEAILIPELLPKNSKLKTIADFMQENNIDVVQSTKTVKVGIFKEIDISNLSKENLTSALSSAYVHQLDYADYRIQTNVPNHINQSRLFGTQVRKLIMNRLNMLGDYSSYTDGQDITLSTGETVSLTGRNLVRFYNELIMSNIFETFDEFLQEVENPEKISNLLIQSVINNERESLDSLISYSLTDDVNFLIPLFEGALEHDSAAFLLSVFKKKVNKQKMSGGSAVQVSAYGINNVEEDNNSDDGGLKYVCDPETHNILYAECEIPWDLSYTDAQGNEVKIDYYQYCDTEGNLKPSKKGGTSLLEDDFPGILDIVAYRIPTESDYSMLNLKVVKFSSPVAGGTIKVPAQGTTIAGFDFDIDKLYLLRKEFKALAYTKEDQQKWTASIWKNIYEQHPEIVNKLREAKYLMRKDHISDLGEALLAAFNSSNIVSENIPSGQEGKEERKRFLYQYWSEAGLEGSPEEIFSKFLLENPDFNLKITFEEYDYSIPPTSFKDGNAIIKGNTRVARNNMLLNIIQNRLKDQATMKSRTTPGGFANASYDARKMRHILYSDPSLYIKDGVIDFEKLENLTQDVNLDPEPEYDPSDPMTRIFFDQLNQAGKHLIGIFANQNTHHAFCTLMQKFQLKNPISFCGNKFNDLLKPPSNRDVDLTMHEYLAAAVDASKDPVLNYLNFNTITADAGALLARLGYTTFEIGLLFNQPIIKKICELSKNEGLSAELAINNIKFSLQEKRKTAKKSSVKANNDTTTDTFIKNIIMYKENPDVLWSNDTFYAKQLAVLELFENILSTSRNLSDFILNTKFTAANAVSSTFGGMYEQQLRMQSFVDSLKPVLDKEGKEIPNPKFPFEIEVNDLGLKQPMTDEYDLSSIDRREYFRRLSTNPFAYEQCMYDINKMALTSLCQYYPYETTLYSSLRNRLSEVCTSGIVSGELIDKLHSEIPIMVMQQMPGEFQGEASNKFLPSMSNRRFYNTAFVEIFPQIKKALGSNNIIDKLIVSVDIKNYNAKNPLYQCNLILDNSGGMPSDVKDTLRDAWERLLYSTESITLDYKGTKIQMSSSDVAKCLFFYNFYKEGYKFNYLSFMHLCPAAVKAQLSVTEDSSYSDFLYKILDEKVCSILSESTLEDMIQQFILNHLDEYKLVSDTEKNSKAKTYIQKLAIVNSEIQDEFVFDFNSLDVSTEEGKALKQSLETSLLKTTSASGELIFKPCIKIKDYYYICDNNCVCEDGKLRFNASSDGSMRFVKVSSLGNKTSMVYSTNFKTAMASKDTYLKTEGEDPNVLLNSLSPKNPIEEKPSPTAIVPPETDNLIKQIAKKQYDAMQELFIVTANSKFAVPYQDLYDSYASMFIEQKIDNTGLASELADLNSLSEQELINAIERMYLEQEIKDDSGEPIC